MLLGEEFGGEEKEMRGFLGCPGVVDGRGKGGRGGKKRRILEREKCRLSLIRMSCAVY
jgi:hypothetical protein